MSDPRYEYVRCETCGETFQRLDFRANPHASSCANPKEPPLVEPKDKVTLRCPGCGAISDVQKKYAFRLNCTGCLLDKGKIVKLVEVPA